jgi:arylesterase/paraoxonase
VVPGLAGAEEVKIDRADELAFVAVSDPSKTTPKDGLYAIALGNPGVATRLAGTPMKFRPLALSLFRDANGALTLMVLDRTQSGAFAITIFDVAIAGGVRLSERADIGGGMLIDPAFIAAAGPDQFYVTNEHTSRTEFGRALEDWLLLPRADVVYFDGNFFRRVAQNLSFARGIALSPDRTELYVAAAAGRAIESFPRNPFNGSLGDTASFGLPSGPDGIDVDAQGNLWVAAHPKLKDLTMRYGAPSQVFEIVVAKGNPAEARLVYANDGADASAAGALASAGNRLIIAEPSKLIACAVPSS